MRAKTVYLGLGSNLGDRQANLRQAIASLNGAAGVEIVRESSVYETAPLLLTSQPWFLNMAVEARTSLFPLQLLHLAQEVERSLGRKARRIAKGPRTIDIDILMYGRSIIQSAELTVPHPGLSERRFVLEPLAELGGGLRHPVTKASVREMLGSATVQVQEIRLWKSEPAGL